jgi:hypothetical protein
MAAGPRARKFSQKNIKAPLQKIPESLGGIQTIYPDIIKPL